MIFRRLYDWVLLWAETPYGALALFLLALSESSFFPIPPDVLLIVLSIGAPKKSFKFALICSVGSVIGGCIGYIIGWQFMSGIGERIITFYGLNQKFDYIRELYRAYDAWAIGIAGFTPIPYKVFTISAGAFKINLWVFIVASVVSRSARFFLVGGLIYFFGPRIQSFIDNYFNLLAVAFIVFLIAGFVVIRYIF
ncbi:MAG: VTT domain-containing protein [Desulfobacterales bacterium]